MKRNRLIFAILAVVAAVLSAWGAKLSYDANDRENAFFRIVVTFIALFYAVDFWLQYKKRNQDQRSDS